MKEFSHPLFDEVYHFKTLNSSFKKAESMIKNYQVNGNFIIISEKENHSIGRDKNVWYAPLGGLWFTMGFTGFKFDSSLTIFIGEIIYKTISEYLQDTNQLFIKWPNDIFFEDKKLAGILTYNLPFFNYYIIGVGINTNVNPDISEQKTVSIKKIAGKEIDNLEFLYNFCEKLSNNLPDFLENGLDNIFFNRHSLLKGKNVTIETKFDKYEGESLGINKKGAILLRLPSGVIQPFYSGKIVSFSD